jgi:hypothetical protein
VEDIMRGILSILLLGFVAPDVEGAALHVPADYATINAALDASSAGDSVLVAPGTYSDYEVRVLQGGGPFTASSVAFLKGGVSLIGEGGRDMTRIDLGGEGTGHAVPVLAYDSGPGTILVQGFTITGAPAGNAGLWSQYLDRMVVRGCSFQGLDGGSRDAGGIYSESVDLEVHDTEFRGCRSDGVEAAAIAHGGGHATLVGSLFSECEGSVIVAMAAGWVNPPLNGEVRACEFRDNIGPAAYLGGFVTLTVEDCVFVGNHTASGASALVVSGGPGGIVEPGPYYVRRNLFAGNSEVSGFGTVFWDRVGGVFEENTLADNGLRGLTLDTEAQHTVTIRRNVFAHTAGLMAVWFTSSGAPLPVSECNVFWDNPGGDTVGFPPGLTDLFVDPLFCGRDSGDYTLARNSPCLPPQSGPCGQIGAFGEGCSEISVDPESWAKTKAKYRDESGRRDEP